MTDTEAVRVLFDELAPVYDQQLRFFATLGAELVQRCALSTGQRVLDIGAGRGAITVPAARGVGRSGRVVAIDNAEGMLAALTADCADLPQVEFRVMDAHRLEFSDSTFDVVTCGFVLHFFDDPARAIAEAFRVLRPGGQLVFSGPPTAPGDSPTRDPRWDFCAELIDEVARRNGASDRPALFSAPPRPLPILCADTGFADIEQSASAASFTFQDPQHYWDWSMSHGFRGFVDSLAGELAAEFRTRMLEALQRMHFDGGITSKPGVVFTTATKP